MSRRALAPVSLLLDIRREPRLSPNGTWHHGTHFESGKALAAGSLESFHGFAEPAASAVRLTLAVKRELPGEEAKKTLRFI